MEYPKMPLAITKNREVDDANERGGILLNFILSAFPTFINPDGSDK